MTKGQEHGPVTDLVRYRAARGHHLRHDSERELDDPWLIFICSLFNLMIYSGLAFVVFR